MLKRCPVTGLSLTHFAWPSRSRLTGEPPAQRPDHGLRSSCSMEHLSGKTGWKLLLSLILQATSQNLLMPAIFWSCEYLLMQQNTYFLVSDNIFSLPDRLMKMKAWRPVSSVLRPPEYVTGAADSLISDERTAAPSRIESNWQMIGPPIENRDSIYLRLENYSIEIDLILVGLNMTNIESRYHFFQSLTPLMYWTRILALSPTHCRMPIRWRTCSSFLNSRALQDVNLMLKNLVLATPKQLKQEGTEPRALKEVFEAGWIFDPNLCSAILIWGEGLGHISAICKDV